MWLIVISETKVKFMLSKQFSDFLEFSRKTEGIACIVPILSPMTEFYSKELRRLDLLNEKWR